MDSKMANTTAPLNVIQFRESRLLGTGGMAQIRAGWLQFPWGDEPCAVKRIHENLLDIKYVRAFEREARINRALTRGHENLVTIEGYGVDAHGPYIVMERIEGPQVHKARRQLQGNPRLALRIAYDMLSALEYVHRRGYLHRDISGGNVLLDARGRVMLCDLGLARTASGRHTSKFCGTTAYASPERLRHAPATEASDVFSLGVVVWEALTGEMPFGEDYPLETIVANMGRPLPDLPAGTPDHLVKLLTSMLAYDPAHRPGAAAALEIVAERPGDIANDHEVIDVIAAWRDAESAEAARAKAAKPAVSSHSSDAAHSSDSAGSTHPSASTGRPPSHPSRWDLAMRIDRLPKILKEAFWEALDELDGAFAGLNEETRANLDNPGEFRTALEQCIVELPDPKPVMALLQWLASNESQPGDASDGNGSAAKSPDDDGDGGDDSGPTKSVPRPPGVVRRKRARGEAQRKRPRHRAQPAAADEPGSESSSPDAAPEPEPAPPSIPSEPSRGRLRTPATILAVVAIGGLVNVCTIHVHNYVPGSDKAASEPAAPPAQPTHATAPAPAYPTSPVGIRQSTHPTDRVAPADPCCLQPARGSIQPARPVQAAPAPKPAKRRARKPKKPAKQRYIRAEDGTLIPDYSTVYDWSTAYDDQPWRNDPEWEKQ